MAGTSVTELVALLQDATSKDVLPALEELQRRFQGHGPEHPAARSEAVTAGAPVLLVALLQAGSGGDARPAAAAAEAISLLAREADSSVDDALAAAGVAPALVALLGEPSACASAAARAIGFLLQADAVGAARAALRAAGVAPALVAMLTKEGQSDWYYVHGLAAAYVLCQGGVSEPDCKTFRTHAWMSSVAAAAPFVALQGQNARHLGRIFRRFTVETFDSVCLLPPLADLIAAHLRLDEGEGAPFDSAKPTIQELIQLVEQLPSERSKYVTLASHLLVLGAAPAVLYFCKRNPLPADQSKLRNALTGSIRNPGRILNAICSADDRASAAAAFGALACTMAACRGPQELPLLQQAKALLGSRDYAARVAEALLRDDLLGASARRDAAALIRETLQVGQPWPPPSSDSPRPTKRQRSMRDDFNRRDIPGSLCFSVAGQEFYGSAHLIRASSATLRDAMDAMDTPASSQPLPLARPASIPEDRMYGLFLACMKHAHLEEGVATLGEDPLALWECAR
eukprot:jgi/Tetstr1/445001/TSEL_032809.t1